jgi:sensor histidine kinase YesM
MFFASSSDLVYPPLTRFFRFFFLEIAFLPWKIIPFYLLFYLLIPRYFAQKAYLKLALWFLLALFVCLIGYRSMIIPVNQIWYNETPDFQIYSLKRILYSLTEILPAIALASTAKLLKGRISALQKLEALQQEKRSAELNFLKAQTNPHFLFNTLNNLYGLARKQDENTAPAIMKLANLMRYILHEGRAESIPIAKEIEIIEAYIELEKLRYDESLQVNFKQEIDDLQQPIAPLILLPFVENAFKHGASENRFGTRIEIVLKVEKGKLHFRIENSVDQEVREMKEGIGLENVRRQLELIYGEGFDLKIEVQSAAFVVELNKPRVSI